MKIKKQSEKIIRQLTAESFKEGRIVERRAVLAIKILKSLPGQEAIRALSRYLKNLKRKEREHTMYIETAVPLSPVQIKKMEKIAEREITKVSVNIKPEILGGFKLRIGDEIWDESILEKINQVREAING